MFHPNETKKSICCHLCQSHFRRESLRTIFSKYLMEMDKILLKNLAQKSSVDAKDKILRLKIGW
jgi:hypothetical protein